MNVVIRVDSSIEIGTGHVMRCLTLAKQLKCKDIQVTFICRELVGNSIDLINKEGFSVISLPKKSNYSDLNSIKTTWKTDAQETINAIEEVSVLIDLLIVDHYGLDRLWELKLRPYTKKIMVIDDLANRFHHCDILLDQNFFLDMENRYHKLIPQHCIRLIGPDYLLLRDEFLEMEIVKEFRKRVKNILVFFGGTDPTGETIKLLNSIKNISLGHLQMNIVVGIANPNRNYIKKVMY